MPHFGNLAGNAAPWRQHLHVKSHFMTRLEPSRTTAKAGNNCPAPCPPGAVPNPASGCNVCLIADFSLLRLHRIDASDCLRCCLEQPVARLPNSLVRKLVVMREGTFVLPVAQKQCVQNPSIVGLQMGPSLRRQEPHPKWVKTSRRNLKQGTGTKNDSNRASLPWLFATPEHVWDCQTRK